MLTDDVRDLGEPVELAPRVWWVGSMIPGDRFQCHVYLIEQGAGSVLIDPGSALNVTEVIRKVDAVVGLRNVRWLVCSHADPDILGAVPALLDAGLRPDAALVTHWRDAALITHNGWSFPFWPIEDHDWRLPLDDRTLRFIFTPYAHFAGAFCTFDERSGTLFSSDLFGAFTDDPSLVASTIGCFPGIRAFHEHYMPSQEALSHAMAQLDRVPIKLVAPQHGQLLPEPLVAPVMDGLRRLECGLYLLAGDDPGLKFLFTASRTLHDVTATILEETSFPAIAAHLLKLADELLAARSIEFWARSGEATLCFDGSDCFVGRVADPPDDVAAALHCPEGPGEAASDRLVVPLQPPGAATPTGIAVLALARRVRLDASSRKLLAQVAQQVAVALEREVARRLVEIDRATLYGQATHDPLTGLYNRLYLADVAPQMCARDERAALPSIAALMIDVDHFKSVNDTYGHPAGDDVLRQVAHTIGAAVRAGDVPVRYGGEEFLVVLAGVSPVEAVAIAERVRMAVAANHDCRPSVTVSIGVAMRRSGEDCHSFVGRADQALYAAKTSGRNRVDVAP
jgi:diguanylate cyclase (GGDEF)-like protein